MKTALNRVQGRKADSGGMFIPADLDSPEAQPVLARIGGAICAHSPIDRVQHAKLVAAVVLAAKRRPNNAYAKATL